MKIRVVHINTNAGQIKKDYAKCRATPVRCTKEALINQFMLILKPIICYTWITSSHKIPFPTYLFIVVGFVFFSYQNEIAVWCKYSNDGYAIVIDHYYG
jgi:hypothetical protein